MSEHDLENLLGGFVADTLTPEEKQTLYTAALQEQQLFNTLADEQTLKELLSDVDVRRRVLASLKQRNASDSGGSLPWLDWFRRPAGLAFAGGLAAAALAVVLGIRIYQDSLRQAAQSVVTDEPRPAGSPARTPSASEPTPSQITEPKIKTEKPAELEIPPAKKDMLFDKPAKQERSDSLSPEKQRASDIDRNGQKQRTELDQARRAAEAPVAARSKSAEEVTSSADQKLAASSAPPATEPESKRIQPPAGGRVAVGVTPALSARALFYGGEPVRAETQPMAKEQAMKPLAESAPRANRLEQKPEGLLQVGKAAGTATQLRPLGLRYSLVVRGIDGQEQEVDAATASERIHPVFLTIETNQDAYLQVWEKVGSSTPKLLWPERESGQISQKITTGQRQYIPLPREGERIILTARISRVPSEPLTREEAATFDRHSSNQLQESVTTSNRTGSQERATFVVKQDPSSTAQLVVDIPLGQ